MKQGIIQDIYWHWIKKFSFHRSMPASIFLYWSLIYYSTFAICTWNGHININFIIMAISEWHSTIFDGESFHNCTQCIKNILLKAHSITMFGVEYLFLLQFYLLQLLSKHSWFSCVIGCLQNTIVYPCNHLTLLNNMLTMCATRG